MPLSATARFDPASFRDPDNRVASTPTAIYRALSPQALEHWRALSATRFFRQAVADGRVIDSELLSAREMPAALHVPLAHRHSSQWVAWLRHRTLPLVSYPYEWSFSMLRDAALLHLDLLEAALAENLVIKDGSPYNIQFEGTRPIFIDVGSFAPIEPGQPWTGYRQFCQLFLFPLLLSAYKGVPHQPWLRGRLDGIDAETFRRLLSVADLVRPGVLVHGFLQAMLQSSAGNLGNIRRELRAAGFRKELIVANVRRLRRLIDRLPTPVLPTAWSTYEHNAPYSAAARHRKVAMVRQIAAHRSWSTIWDLGCHTGSITRQIAPYARSTLGLDADPESIDRLYRDLARNNNDANILPLVYDLTDSVGGLGWRGAERRGLCDRGRPQLTVCLALVHHWSIAGRIPLEQIVDWLATLQGDLVIEFADRGDPVVRAMLERHAGVDRLYGRQHFETLLAERFQIVQRETLPNSARTLYWCQPIR